MKAQRKRWITCPTCSMLVFTSHGLGYHQCPKKVKDKRDVELDAVVNEEMSTFNTDVRKFWRSKDVQFYEWLAERKRL